MPKASQTPSKAKSSTKAEAKHKIMKPKSKKRVRPSREPIPTPARSPSISSTVPTSSFPVPAAFTIPTSTIPPLQKPTTHAPELIVKNTSKSTKVNATSRKSFKKVPDAATQVQHHPSKLDVLVSTIDAALLDTLPPTGEKPQVEKFTVEKGVSDMGKAVDTTAVEPVVEGEGSKEPVPKKASAGLSFRWDKDEDDDIVISSHA
uniref:Salivary glue protein Sgs-3-like n=1 Tax=Nicotiana tabacum TaxID=4097 RepID=A0A1S3Z8V0_TOBAC|nr:PREDICTED: salivary glue protein Sgs-3-like [Nicotiana tabacum]